MMRWNQGDKYEGDWQEGLRHGEGTYFSKVSNQYHSYDNFLSSKMFFKVGAILLAYKSRNQFNFNIFPPKNQKPVLKKSNSVCKLSKTLKNWFMTTETQT